MQVEPSGIVVVGTQVEPRAIRDSGCGSQVNHLKQIAHIDPMRDFEQALFEAAATTATGKIPRVRVKKHDQELAMQQAFDNLGKQTDPITGSVVLGDEFLGGFHD